MKKQKGGGVGGGSAAAAGAVPPPATAGGAASSVAEAVAVVGSYLRAQNRPYSAIQLHDNLHGRVNKALMESALATLVEGGAVCRKEYGKAAIFWPSQGAFSAVTQEEVAALNAKNEQLEAAVAAAGAARRAVEARLGMLTAGPSGAALEAALGEARGAVAALEARLAAAGSGGGGKGPGGSGGGSDSMAAAGAAAAPPRVLSAAEKVALKQTFARYRACWATRRAAAIDFAGALADGGGPKPAALFKDAGVETDEEAGISLRDLVAL